MTKYSSMRKISGDHIPADLTPSVATIGFFDGVHAGHQHLIAQVVEEARKAGLISLVVTFDNHPRQVTTPEYIPQMLTTGEEKMVKLEKTSIDACALFHFTPQLAALSAREFMAQILRDRLHVRKLVIGYDNRFGHNRSEGFEDYVRHGRDLGMEVIASTPFTIDGEAVSSSRIRRLLAAGETVEAARCLGAPYIIAGQVVEGFQLGRRLGFPTANIDMGDEKKLLPAAGVYAVRVRVEGSQETKPAVMNIGQRPTFGGEETSVEVHIIHFDGNLYGHRVMVAVGERLREERKFRSAEALAGQLRKDVLRAQQVFDKEKSKER